MRFTRLLSVLKAWSGHLAGWARRAFRFQRGNALDQVFRLSLVFVILVLVAAWVGTNLFLPPTDIAVEERSTGVSHKPELAEVVRDELARLLETEYPWVIEQPVVTPVAVSLPEEPPRPKPEPLPPRDEVLDEVVSVSFERILWPVRGEVVTTFGWQRHPQYQDWRFHGGLELASHTGEPIRTVLPGRVADVRPGHIGFEVVIEHGSGWESLYKAVDSPSVRPGEVVKQNQTIGEAGSSGLLFFALSYQEEPIDPQSYMR